MARTPKAQALGRELRRVRESAELTVRDVGALLRVNHGTISRWETGERPPKPEQVAQLLSRLNVTGERYEQIMTMSYGHDHASWVAATMPEQRQQLQAMIEFERESTRIVVANPVIVPGLLQTDAYIKAIMSGLSPDEARGRGNARRERRNPLVRQQEPPLVLAFVGVAAVHQVIGGRPVMAEQIRYLIELATRPNVEVRIMPSDGRWNPALSGAFEIVETSELGSIVMLENLVCSQFLHERADVNVYREAVDMLDEVAMKPDESVRFMANVANRMEQSP
jgi:transcriptional regulator with XRE-family HTH domain